MKKFILAVLVAIAFGNANCVMAADNQGTQLIEEVGAGVLGAAIGYNGAKAAGANQPWAIAGGIAGANVGVSIVRGYQQPARRGYRTVARGQQGGYRTVARGQQAGWDSCDSQYGNDEELNRECQIGAANRAAANRSEERAIARTYGGGGSYGGCRGGDC